MHAHHSTDVAQAQAQSRQQDDSGSPSAQAALCIAAVHAGTAVLTNRTLWQLVVDCMTGYPHPVRRAHENGDRRALADADANLKTRSLLRAFLTHRGVLVHLAIAAGDLDALATIFAMRKRLAYYQTDPHLDVRHVMRCAVLFNRVDVLQCIAALRAHESGDWTWEPKLLPLAVHLAETTDVRILEWIYSHAPREHTALLPAHMTACASAGRLDLVQWLCEHQCPLPQRALHEAAVNGHAHILAYLYRHTRARCKYMAINKAAALGHVAVIDVIVAHERKQRCRDALTFAARNGRLLVAQRLIASSIHQDTTHVIDAAARSGNVELMAYLHTLFPDSGCTPQAMDNAARHGHLEVIEFLYGHRSDGCAPQTLATAATHGRLEIVEFLHAHYPHLACPPAAFDMAAASGFADVVAFLQRHRTEGCTPNALNWAAKHSHLDVVQFLCEHRRDGDVATALKRAAAAASDLAVIAYLHARLGSDESAYPAFAVAAFKGVTQSAACAAIATYLLAHERPDEPVTFLTHAVMRGACAAMRRALQHASETACIEAERLALAHSNQRFADTIHQHIQATWRSVA